jgi:hypothetical protein
MGGGSSHDRRRTRRLLSRLKKTPPISSDKQAAENRTDLTPKGSSERFLDIAYDSSLQVGLVLVISVAIAGFTTNPFYGYGVALMFAWVYISVAIFKNIKSTFLWKRVLARFAMIVLVGMGLYATWIYMPRPEPRNITLTFRDSPYLTKAVERRLTRDFNDMRNYFSSLDIAIGSEVPPISIVQGSSSGLTENFGLPGYRNDLTIGSDVLGDPMACTRDYAYWVIGRLFLSQQRAVRVLPPDPNSENKLDGFQQIMLEQTFVAYFNWSFWGTEVPYGHKQPEILWEIRSKLGDIFADRLIAAMLRTTVDTPDEGADKNSDIYFVHKLKIAYSIVGSGDEKWLQIVDILKKNNLPTG